MWVSLVLCEGYYKPISCIGVNVFQWKVITLVGCLLVQVCLKAVYLGPFFLLSTLITYHHLFLSPQLYCMPMTPSFLRQCCYLLIAPFFSLTFRHLSDGAPTPVCLLMQARVFSHFCNHSPLASVDYSLNDSVISCVSSCCDLGVIFSSDHSWTEHYKVISKNAYNQLYVIKRSFSAFCPPPIKRLLYISQVHSKVSYCSQVWRPMLIKDIATLERIQRRSTKFITGSPSLSYRKRLISLHLLPLMYFYEYLDVILPIQSLQHSNDSFNIHDYITFSSHTTRTSSSTKISLKHCSTNRSRHFYFNRVARLWNVLLPIDLSLPTIKVLLNKFLWSHFLSTLNLLTPVHITSSVRALIVTLGHQPIHNFPVSVLVQFMFHQSDLLKSYLFIHFSLFSIIA